MIAAHATVLTGIPEGAALFENYVAGHDVLLGGFFGAETFPGAAGGGAVGAALGLMGSGAVRGEWKEILGWSGG